MVFPFVLSISDSSSCSKRQKLVGNSKIEQRVVLFCVGCESLDWEPNQNLLYSLPDILIWQNTHTNTMRLIFQMLGIYFCPDVYLIAYRFCLFLRLARTRHTDGNLAHSFVRSKMSTMTLVMSLEYYYEMIWKDVQIDKFFFHFRPVTVTRTHE